MNQRRVFTQGRIGRQSRGQIVVVEIDEADCLFNDLFVNGGNSGDDIANVTQLFAGESSSSWTVKPNLLRGTSLAVRTAATPLSARPAHVEALDLCVRDGTTKSLAWSIDGKTTSTV